MLKPYIEVLILSVSGVNPEKNIQQKIALGSRTTKFFDFSKNSMENKILNMRMTSFQPESLAMAHAKNVVKLHLYCHNVLKYLSKTDKIYIFG